MGSVSKETSWPKWVPNYWLCWLWIHSSSAWNGDTSLSVYLVYLHLRGIVSTWIEGFWTKKLGQGLNLDICCYAAWQAALFFFFRRNDSEWSLSFFNEVRTEIKKKTTCLQQIHPLLHPVGLPNQLENLKWKLLNSKEPTFLTNHPPRNYDVSHLGKS